MNNLDLWSSFFTPLRYKRMFPIDHRFIELDDDDYHFSHLSLEQVRSLYKKWKNTKKISLYNIPLTFKKIKYHKLDYADVYIQYILEKLETNLRLEISVYFIIHHNKKILSQTNEYILKLNYQKNIYGIVDTNNNYVLIQDPKFLDCFTLDLDYIMDKIFRDTKGWGVYLSNSSTRLTPNPV